ncbi:hypothetical protein ACLMJK_005744 [Lecanora helva]
MGILYLAKECPSPESLSFTGNKIAGRVITRGGQAVKINGTLISLKALGGLIMGSSTIQFSAVITPIPSDFIYSGLNSSSMRTAMGGLNGSGNVIAFQGAGGKRKKLQMSVAPLAIGAMAWVFVG